MWHRVFNNRRLIGMETRIKKWGDSLALRIPQAFADDLGFAQDTTVEITVEARRLIITPITDSKLRLDDLLAGITPDNLHHENDTGKPMGNEGF
jgi:antitoxin MazE